MNLTLEMHVDLRDMMASAQTRIVERQSHRVTVHECVYKGRTLRFVYDKTRKQIVTFLPLEQQQADPT